MTMEPGCDFGKDIKAQFPYIKEKLDCLEGKIDKLNGRMWKSIWALLIIAGGAIITNILR